MSTIPPSRLTPEQLNFAESAQWTRSLHAALMDLRVSMPAIVLSFDPATQTVTAQIAIREIVKTTQGPQNENIIPVNGVPVVLPSAGGFSLTLPLKPGDEGMLVFCDMCIDLWWSRGAGQNQTSGVNTEPQNQLEQRRHHMSDCGFYPGGRSQPRALGSYSTNSAQLRSDDASVIVDIAAAGITLTGPKLTLNATGDIDLNASGNVHINGAQIVAASSGNNTKVDGKTFLLHTHNGVQTGGGVSGPVT